MLTAKTMSKDKVEGLSAGADDYVTKPFELSELVARVRSALRRSHEMGGANPLTRLPGNVAVQEELKCRVRDGAPFALMYIDLDNFKAFNDHYGFLRGDEAIKLLSRCISDAVDTSASEFTFIGHIGGDDFVAIVQPEFAEHTAGRIIQCWDGEASGLYDPPEAERGYIEVPDRRNELHRFPIMTVSIGIATNTKRPITTHWEAAEIATEVKQFAKRQARSLYAVDRRSG